MNRLMNKGFTLLEIILVIVIFGIISVAASELLSSQLNNYFTNQAIRSASLQGRYAIDSMVLHIREIKSTANLTTASAQQLSFTDLDGNTISYRQSGTNLLYSYNGTETTLLSGLVSSTGLQFSYLGSNGFKLSGTPAVTQIKYINININILSNNVNYSLRTTVFLRS